jgi:RNA polymerase sigma factor (sigma-70 family)
VNSQEELDAIGMVLAGRTEAFETIVRNYQNLVASAAYRMGAPRDDIEDIVSEVFVKVYRHLPAYRPEFALSTWIYRIATNHTLDHLRRHRRDRDQEELPLSAADTGPSPRENVLGSERVRLVRQALTELPEKYRIPVVLMHVEGKGIDEIASILSLPAGTVKTRLSRGRERLGVIIRRRFPSLLPAPDGEPS